MIKPLPLLTVFLIASQPLLASQARRKPAADSSQTPTRPSRESRSAEQEARATEQRKLENLVRVRGFADHIQGFKNLTAKVRGLVGIADVLWKEDETYARKLFGIAYEAAGSNAIAEGADQGGGSDEDVSTPDYGWLRREVAAGIARHDRAWARNLTVKEAEASKSGKAYLGMAAALVSDDPKQAVQYIEMALDAGVDPNIVDLLHALRAKDQDAADALYVRSLGWLAAQSRADMNQLVLIGNYVLLPSPDVTLVVFGRHVVFNVAGVNPSASLVSIKAFLNTAVDILLRQISSSPGPSFDKEHAYIAACILLPWVREFVPERAAALEEAMRSLSPELPDELSEAAIQAKSNAARPASVTTLEDAQKDLASIRDDARRDLRCIALSYGFFRKENFPAAKAIAGEVKDLPTRDKLLILLGFEEGSKLVDGGRLNEAMALAMKLAPGIERAVLWLAIAHRQIEHGDRKAAGTTMTWAVAEAGRLEDPRRAVLILRAAADLAGFDQVLASQTMGEAIRTINRVSPYSPLRMEWSEPVNPQLLYVRFPLQAGGLDFQLAGMLRPLTKIDIEGTIYQVMNLEDEEARGQGLAVLASIILERRAGG